jgi:hypothetical protein
MSNIEFDYNEFMRRMWKDLEDPRVEFSSTGDCLVIRVSCWDRVASARRSVERHTLWLDVAAVRFELASQLADVTIHDLTMPLSCDVQWTKKLPTTAGFYWLVDRDSGCVQVAEVTICDGEARMFTPLGGRINPLDISWWSENRLESPEEPDDC